MAESAVGFLLRTLTHSLQNRGALIWGLHGEIEQIKLKLETIQAFLKDVDRKESSELVRTWARQMRDVAYKLEDIIDEYMFHLNEHQEDTLKGRLLRAIHLPKSLYYKHQIATRLQKIKNQIELDSIDLRHRLYLEPSSSDADQRWLNFGESAIFSRDDDVVGIVGNRDLLIRWLTMKESCLVLNSVVGMGGVGKTTLVAKVYKSLQVKNHFSCCAWVTISRSYKIDNVLRSIIKDLFKSKEDAPPNDISSMDYRRLVDILHSYLQNKRYLIVLDDVWDHDVWNLLKVAFQDHECGSRIVITTRKSDVVDDAGCSGVNSLVLHLRTLGENDAWELFCRKAFWDNPNRVCPPELEASARAIVARCENLPLAIVTIGGLISLKEKTKCAWEKVQKDLTWELNKNPRVERVSSVLLLSYHDLPFYLKSCFLHMCMFPEDYEIRPSSLIRKWIAEGFVEKRTGTTMEMEEVGDTYLEELVHRSMVQINERISCRKSYRVHDILRDLALSIAQEEDFGSVQDAVGTTRSKRPRRLTIYNCNDNVETNMAYLRSFMLFSPSVIPSSTFYKTFSSFKLLRVLNLQSSSINRVPDEVVKLFHLRYLSLRDTNVEKLPDFIGRLRNLQTLDLRGSKVKVLSKGVEKLKNLRHLYMFYQLHEGVQAPPGICEIKCLQGLDCIKADKVMVKQIENLSHLRRLGISNVKKEEGPDLCASIRKMYHLLKLVVVASQEENILKLETLSSPPTHLQNIQLYGRMEKLPAWICSLEYLTSLLLVKSQFKEDPLPLIQDLPSLLHLRLIMAYDGRDMCFCARRFLKLKTLAIDSFGHLEQIVIEEGSMPYITQIVILICSRLRGAPEGIEYLTFLEMIYLQDMSNNFLATFHEDERERIGHIQHSHHESEGTSKDTTDRVSSKTVKPAAVTRQGVLGSRTIWAGVRKQIPEALRCRQALVKVQARAQAARLLEG